MQALSQRRKLLLAGGTLVVLGLGAWFEPTCVVKGWLRGEAFYQGRPTSYWSRELSRWRKDGWSLLLRRHVSRLRVVGFEREQGVEAARWNPFVAEPDVAAEPEVAAVEPAVAAAEPEGDAVVQANVDALTTTYRTNLLAVHFHRAGFGYTRQPGLLDKAVGWFGVTLEYPDRPALLTDDPDAVPVLRELAHDPDETVRDLARRALDRQGAPADGEEAR